MTIEYTSQYDADYYEQVKEALPETIGANRVFSFRNQLPDLWYELHRDKALDNVDDIGITLSFNTSKTDFPPNLTDLRISGLSLFIAGGTGRTIRIEDLRFVQDGTTGNGTGGGAQASQLDEGIISTAKGNAAAWTAISGRPFGRWTIKVTDPQTLELLKSEEVKDVVFVLSIRGRVTAGGWL
jgi:hypothetical protein